MSKTLLSVRRSTAPTTGHLLLETYLPVLEYPSCQTIMPYSMFFNRIIVHGREIISCIVPGSAQPFNFKEHFHLTEEEVNESEIYLSLVSYILKLTINSVLLPAL